MPNDVSHDTCTAPARDKVHVGYLPVPPLHRLMQLRNALVALKGPLSNDPELQANLRNRLFNAETDDRVLGKLTTPLST